MTIWTPPENTDHRVLINDRGQFVKVIKGTKTLRKLLEEHRDARIKDDNGQTRDRLTNANKTEFNRIHKVNSR